MKIETIRFVARDEDEAYFIRAMHQLAAGCLLLGAREQALTALVGVVSGVVGERQPMRWQGDRQTRRQRTASGDSSSQPTSTVDGTGHTSHT
jgi:hypothetical protein